MLHKVLYQELYCIIITNLYALHYDYYHIFLHYNNELYDQLYVLFYTQPCNTCSYLRDIACVYHIS